MSDTNLVLKIDDLEIEYSIKDNAVSITSCRCMSSSVELPDTIEGLSVKTIGPKAMLGARGVREIKIPASVEAIGDWAFSQCAQLKSVWIGNRDISLGKRVFEGDTSIESIYIGGADLVLYAPIYGTLAAGLPGSHLLEAADRGTEQWCERYDLALLHYIAEDDIEGYSDRALCGEEDISYDGIGSVDGELLGESYAYILEVSKNKCFLVLNRLVNDVFLNDSCRDKYVEYIKKHSYGTAGSGAWNVIKDLKLSNMWFTRLYMDIVSPGEEDISGMLEDLSDNGVQIKAYLIKYKQKHFGTREILSGLIL